MIRGTSWRPAAVVFDCDGLLLDTEPCWTVAETEVFGRRGLPFGPEQKAIVIGQSLQAAGVAMAAAFGEQGQGPAIAAELLALVEVVVADGARAMPGAAEVVELAAARVPVAIASNSPRALLDAALRRGGFEGTFAISIAADEVERPKPAPDLYLTACALLDRKPTECLAFEDSSTGLRAAAAAGLATVAVPSLPGLPGAVLPADLVVPALTDPALIEWISRWPPLARAQP